MAPTAAETLRLTAKDLLELKVIEEIVPEPLGGAHHNHEEAARYLGEALGRQIKRLKKKKTDVLLQERFEKYRGMGVFSE
jgi:acetyl-CoA carboxylase carboxyl transferase subunit alpha